MSDLVSFARSKRDAAPVAFARLLDIRSEQPDVPVAAIEGREDVGVWKVWFIRNGFSDHIELLPCGGKEKVFKLKQIVSRNRRIKDKPTIYIVDRDYDDWAGFTPSKDVFMTDRYAIENYFICHNVLDHILNTSFSCAGLISEKRAARDKFCELFEQYRIASEEIQKRVFCIRRARIDTGVSLPKKLNELVEITGRYEYRALDASELPIDKPVDIPEDDLDALCEEFERLPFLERDRGKFHRAFMQHFLQALQSERKAVDRELFPINKPEASFKYSAINFSEWAGVSLMPAGLDEFLSDMLDGDHA